MIRFFDIVISISALIFLSPIILILILLIYKDLGSPFFLQERIGKSKEPFTLVKFRTMKINSPSVPTHHIDPILITTIGKYLRVTKLDELPQLINVIKGEMSLVGPRPCLVNQHDLIREREFANIFNVRPGITGLAQINKIDMSDPKKLTEIDEEMIKNFNIRKYFFYIFKTALFGGFGDNARKYISK